MKVKYLTLLVFSCYSIIYAQVQTVINITRLAESISESSGLIYFDNRLITHNDSGNQNEFYEINTSNGNIERTVVVTNASNIDWEDIADDENYIYIGDFGNNSGNRTNLRIFKISKDEYLNNLNVQAETIEFSFDDQTDFTPNFQNTEFDVEGLISFGENLLIFTKDWINNRTKAYSVSKTPGTYSISSIAEYNVNGLITGATYNLQAKELVLSGYTNSVNPFLWVCKNFNEEDVSCSNVFRDNSLGIGLFRQIEGITHIKDNRYYLTSEFLNLPIFSSNARLYEFRTVVDNLETNDNIYPQDSVAIYPNPVSDMLNFSSKVEHVELYDINGKVLRNVTNTNHINVSDLNSGTYIAVITLNGETETIKFIKQ